MTSFSTPQSAQGRKERIETAVMLAKNAGSRSLHQRMAKGETVALRRN